MIVLFFKRTLRLIFARIIIKYADPNLFVQSEISEDNTMPKLSNAYLENVKPMTFY